MSEARVPYRAGREKPGSVEAPWRKFEQLEEPPTDFIADLVSYWERKRQGRLAPRRADLDPADIPSHLPYFYIVDVVDDGADFLVRLAGTQIAASLPRDPTGKQLSEILRDVPDALEDALQLLRTVLEEKRPGYSRGEVFWLRERSYRWFAAVRLPLSEDGATVNRIIGVVTPISCG
jgi:hypothetical protein